MNAQDRLRVFISSRMHELKDLRAILHRELEKLGIDAFVYEADFGARPDDPETVSLQARLRQSFDIRSPKSANLLALASRKVFEVENVVSTKCGYIYTYVIFRPFLI